MSLLPLKLDIALQRLSQPVVVYETTGQRVDGLWQATKGVERTVNAPVFIADAEKIQILTRGDVAEGGLVIHTVETFYVQNPLATTVQDKQTFVKYDDMLWRVISKARQYALNR